MCCIVVHYASLNENPNHTKDSISDNRKFVGLLFVRRIQ